MYFGTYVSCKISAYLGLIWQDSSQIKSGLGLFWGLNITQLGSHMWIRKPCVLGVWNNRSIISLGMGPTNALGHRFVTAPAYLNPT